jgi:hypothetical protein
MNGVGLYGQIELILESGCSSPAQSNSSSYMRPNRDKHDSRRIRFLAELAEQASKMRWPRVKPNAWSKICLGWSKKEHASRSRLFKVFVPKSIQYLLQHLTKTTSRNKSSDYLQTRFDDEDDQVLGMFGC